MRRLAQVIAGTLALGFMLLYVPWELSPCTPASCSHTDMWDDPSYLVFVVSMQVAVYAIIATLVLIGVLGMRDPAEASEAAVLAALGQSNGSAVRVAARRGAVDAAWVIGAGFAVTGVLHVVKVVTSDSPLGAAAGAWAARLIVAIIFGGALIAAHAIDAARPRKSPVAVLNEDAAEPGPRRFSLCARAMVFGGTAAAAAGVIAGVAIAHDPASGDVSSATHSVVQGAQITMWFALIAFAFGVGVPLVIEGLRPALVGAARLAGLLKAPRAAAILRARSTTASGASSRTVLAVFGIAMIMGALATANPDPTLTPSYVGTVSMDSLAASEEFAAQYGEIEGVGSVIVAPMLAGDYSIVAVDRDEISAVDPALADILTRHPGALAAPSWMSGTSIYDLAAVGVNATGIVRIATCCVSYIESSYVDAATDNTALLIYAAPGADPAEVAQRVESFSPTTTASASWGTSMAYTSNSQEWSWLILVYYGVVALVCAGPVIALALGVAARRRRDDATLAALGATRRTLRGAAIAETTVLAALAVGGGLLAGALVQTTIATVIRAQDSLDGVITDSYLQALIGSIDWGRLALTFVVAVSIFAAVAWVIGNRARAQLPAEQLRALQSGGIS